MKKFLLILSVMLLLVLPLSSCGKANQGNIAVSGAFALYPMMTIWAEEYQKIDPDVTFDISAGGAGKGMSDVLSNAVDIGMVSRAISADEEANGAVWVSVTKDAVFPTLSAANPYLDQILAQGISPETFTGIFITGDITTWGQVVGDDTITDEIHVYTRSDACGAAETWAKYLGGAAQEDLLGVGIYGDPGLLDAVISDPLGIGYNNLNYEFDMDTGAPVAGAMPAPLDKNSNGMADEDEVLLTKETAQAAVALGVYPSPPARMLNLVTNGAPEGVTKDFIIWVLTDGQQYLETAGYIPLTQAQLDEALAKVQ